MKHATSRMTAIVAVAGALLATGIGLMPVNAETVGSNSPPTNTPRYALTILETATNVGQTGAFDINNNGVVVGWAARSDFFDYRASDAALWRDGKITFVDEFSHSNVSKGLAFSINDREEIAAEIRGGSLAPQRPYLFSANGAVDLAPQIRSSGSADAVNNNGVVVGDFADGPPAIFRNGAVERLIGLRSAHDINDAGVVVGISPSFQAALDRSGRSVPLPSLRDGQFADARGINNRGEVVGVSGREAVIWRDGQIKSLHPEGIRSSWAEAINTSGQVVGTIDGSEGFDSAALFDQGQVFDLNQLTETREWRLITAEAINDSGVIVGEAIRNDSRDPVNHRGYVLTPLHQPRPQTPPVSVFDVRGTSASIVVGVDLGSTRLEFLRNGVIVRPSQTAKIEGLPLFLDEGLAPDSEYTYAVVAIDTSGRRSDPATVKLRTVRCPEC